MSADHSSGRPPGTAEPDTEGLLRVETVFHIADESRGQAVAAKLIDRAHELANSPECECDVDVNVEWIRPRVSAEPSSVPAGGESPAGGHPARR